MGMWYCCTSNTVDSHSYRLQTTHGAVFSSLIKVDFHFSLLTSSSMQMLY